MHLFSGLGRLVQASLALVYFSFLTKSFLKSRNESGNANFLLQVIMDTKITRSRIVHVIG